jgi:hypothetical protein
LSKRRKITSVAAHGGAACPAPLPLAPQTLASPFSFAGRAAREAVSFFNILAAVRTLWVGVAVAAEEPLRALRRRVCTSVLTFRFDRLLHRCSRCAPPFSCERSSKLAVPTQTKSLPVNSDFDVLLKFVTLHHLINEEIGAGGGARLAARCVSAAPCPRPSAPLQPSVSCWECLPQSPRGHHLTSSQGARCAWWRRCTPRNAAARCMVHSLQLRMGRSCGGCVCVCGEACFTVR